MASLLIQPQNSDCLYLKVYFCALVPVWGHIAKMNPFRGHVSRHSRILHKKLKTIYVRVTQIVIEEVIREIEKENCRQKRLWVREWISKRSQEECQRFF